MGDWLPIESAPKDGSYILVTNDDAGNSWIAAYKPVYTSGYRPENPWSSMMLNRRHCNRHSSSKPTVWVPLPEPPDGTPNTD